MKELVNGEIVSIGGIPYRVVKNLGKHPTLLRIHKVEETKK